MRMMKAVLAAAVLVVLLLGAGEARAQSQWEYGKAYVGKRMQFVCQNPTTDPKCGIAVGYTLFQVPTFDPYPQGQGQKIALVIGGVGQPFVNPVLFEAGVKVRTVGCGQGGCSMKYEPYVQLSPSAPSVSNNLVVKPGQHIHVTMTIDQSNPRWVGDWVGKVTIMNWYDQSQRSTWTIYPQQGFNQDVWTGAFKPSSAVLVVDRVTLGVMPRFTPVIWSSMAFDEWQNGGMVRTYPSTDEATKLAVPMIGPLLNTSVDVSTSGSEAVYTWKNFQ